MKRIGQLVFFGAAVLALALYWVTAPEGLPWNGSTHLALAYLGEIVRLPAMPHPVWGCYVQVFGGAVALSAFMAALAAGLLAVLVNRYFGWRFAASAALVWIFLPGVWNRAITGERGICLAAMAVVAAWAANWVATRAWRALRRIAQRAGGGLIEAALPSAEAVKKRGKVNRIAGWVAMGVAGVFAVVSLTLHDYRYGEAASVFARGVVEEAEGLCVVMNGFCDDQIVREMGKKVGGQRSEVRQRNLTSGAAKPLNGADGVRALPAGQHKNNGNVHCLTSDLGPLTWLSLRNDDAYRTNLVSWVRSAFPTETDLWVAARVGAASFVEVAVKSHPERFYLMGGKSTTLEGWERRWEAFKPYLDSSDPFVRVGRRMFGYEGNCIANAMQEKVKVEGQGQERSVPSDSASQHNKKGEPPPLTLTSDLDLKSKEIFVLYKRIYTEIDPGSISALVNMSEMIRRGHAASGDEKKWLQGELEKFFKDAFNRQHAREIVRASGPVRADPALLEKMTAEAMKRIAAKVAAGEKVEYAPEVLTLVEWNNEMVRLMAKGEVVQAGRIARAILSNPKWKGFVPANAVLGSVSAKEGDYMSSAAFFKVAADTTNAVPAAVLNDYADTLFHLGKLDEAEKLARRAVKQSEESFWVARLTLAEVLEKKVDCAASPLSGCSSVNGTNGEIRELLKSVLSHAPAKVCDRIRMEHKGYVR